MNACCKRWLAACACLAAMAGCCAGIAAVEARRAHQAEQWAAAVEYEAQEWEDRIGVEP